MSTASAEAPTRPEPPPDASRGRPSPSRSIVGRALLPVALVLSVPIAWLALTKNFAIDEFEYAHVGWLLAHGQVAYRDFFEHHFPLHFWLLGILELLFPSGPSALLGLRLFSAGVLVFTAGAIAYAANRLQRGAALPTLLLLLLSPCWLHWCVEIRPDPLALLFFFGALLCLTAPDPSRLAGGWTGALLALAFLSSQKAVIYGFPLLLVLIVAAVVPSMGAAVRSRCRRALVGGAIVSLAALLYLVATRSLSAAFHWCIVWSRAFEKNVHGFSPLLNVKPYLRSEGLAVLIALVGWGDEARKLRWKVQSPSQLVRWGMVAFLPCALGSFLIQKTAYAYSLVPTVAAVAWFAGIAIARMLDACSQRGRFLLASARVGLFVAAVGWLAARQGPLLWELFQSRNAKERATLATLHRITTPTDPVFDRSGSAFFRPSPDFFFFSNWYLRAERGRALAESIPRELEAQGCAVAIRDARIPMEAPALRAYLDGHFLPIGGGLELWGKRFDATERGERFEAIRAGTYAASRVDGGEVLEIVVDGERVKGPAVSLARGEHRLAFPGTSGPVNLIWVPADGVVPTVETSRETFGSIL